MIEITDLDAEHCIAIRLNGIQRSIDFADCAISFARTFESRGATNVLFDWRYLSAWDDNVRAAWCCRNWQCAAGLIMRTAIVHDRRWHRQAAALAAILRSNCAAVRSWHTREFDRALFWLSGEDSR